MLASRLSSAQASPFIARYAHGGLLGFYAAASSSDTAKLLQTAVDELKTVASGGGGASVDAAKKQVPPLDHIIFAQFLV